MKRKGIVAPLGVKGEPKSHRLFTVYFIGALVLLLFAGGYAAAHSIPIPIRGFGAAATDFPGGEACESGLAVDINKGSVCSTYCNQHQDCPTNWGCKKIRQGNGETVGVCAPYRKGASRGGAR